MLENLAAEARDTRSTFNTLEAMRELLGESLHTLADSGLSEQEAKGLFMLLHGLIDRAQKSLGAREQ